VELTFRGVCRGIREADLLLLVLRFLRNAFPSSGAT
jgi:succinate dehydrogenase flavin-adding protein (antitoxin of CptAB toxin-antitoxin module)